MAKGEDVFAPYAGYLGSLVWPSVGNDRSTITLVNVERNDMAPQYAASSLAKLVRWARVSPAGDIALYPDEDARENAVRVTRLGAALSARAVNLQEEHFHALYGDYAAGAVADPHQLLAEVAVSLGDLGLDWTLTDRITLGARLLERLAQSYVFTSKPSL